MHKLCTSLWCFWGDSQVALQDYAYELVCLPGLAKGLSHEPGRNSGREFSVDDCREMCKVGALGKLRRPPTSCILPPMRSVASKMRTSGNRVFNFCAAYSPDDPAPITTTALNSSCDDIALTPKKKLLTSPRGRCGKIGTRIAHSGDVFTTARAC